MERLTTDHPQDNIETALNLFFVEDGDTWVRGGGEAPDFQDVPLYAYARQLVHDHHADIDTECEDFYFGIGLTEALFNGVDTIEGLIATLYTTAWAFSELREKLKQYEDAEEAGKLLWLPCKPGKTVYRYHIICGNGNVSEEPFTVSAIPDFGSRVFLTKEEATEAMEAKLKIKD